MKVTGIKFTKMQKAGMWGYLDSNGDGQVDFKELQAATDNNEAENRLCDIYISVSISITISVSINFHFQIL